MEEKLRRCVVVATPLDVENFLYTFRGTGLCEAVADKNHVWCLENMPEGDCKSAENRRFTEVSEVRTANLTVKC